MTWVFKSPTPYAKPAFKPLSRVWLRFLAVVNLLIIKVQTSTKDLATLNQNLEWQKRRVG